MKQNLTRSLARLRGTLATFTAGQKVIAGIGAAAVLLAGFMLVRWLTAPDYAPLYSNLAAEDASAVVDELNAQGVPYEIGQGGSMIMVPREKVYETRIALSGQGLPGSSGEGGYSILDDQDLSTSQFQEQTDFKRAMEGELARTIEAIDGVDTAVVHLALPPAKVFADEQDPATASVLVDTSAGHSMRPEQVQAVVNLVSSSVDGLKADKVSVADATGRVLSTNDASGAGTAGRDQQVTDFQQQMNTRIQGMLDKVLGPGNSTVQVTADLDFDKAVKETTTYDTDRSRPPLSEASANEEYNGPAGGAGGSTGVVGPDGQMDPGAGAGGGSSNYVKNSTTRDNAVDTTHERRETAPGSVKSLHVGVVMDSATTGAVNADEIRRLVEATVGIDTERGDTVAVSQLQFDRSADEAAASELAAAKKEAERAEHMELYRNLGIAAGILTLLLLFWWRSRKRAKARTDATTYLVEQIRQESADRAAQTTIEPSPALAALESSEDAASQAARRELTELVERQPEEVAALLRGWLVERS
jgi:flagellar M-ring protein FliF